MGKGATAFVCSIRWYSRPYDLSHAIKRHRSGSGGQVIGAVFQLPMLHDVSSGSRLESLVSSVFCVRTSSPALSSECFLVTFVAVEARFGSLRGVAVADAELRYCCGESSLRMERRTSH